ncbi:hypothetical protein E6O75_ATG10848 [Venturia nashicola]|uniref:Uncharacterized protein n=1 Tax=Venturia nashicola TaxID=86259 RepID=A0A4Z1PJF0_9PEZI|nr:hypothetical protein E6O75_ATG10848 [Venturia nashicola]
MNAHLEPTLSDYLAGRKLVQSPDCGVWSSAVYCDVKRSIIPVSPRDGHTDVAGMRFPSIMLGTLKSDACCCAIRSLTLASLGMSITERANQVKIAARWTASRQPGILGKSSDPTMQSSTNQLTSWKLSGNKTHVLACCGSKTTCGGVVVVVRAASKPRHVRSGKRRCSLVDLRTV